MEKLWFLTDGIKCIEVFASKKEAENEYRKYEDDPDFSYYDFYQININELEDYPEEYELALEEGLV